MNEIDWVSVVIRGIVGVILGPPLGWALWYFYSNTLVLLGLDSFGAFGLIDGALKSVFAGFVLGPLLLISWGIWGESILASLSNRLSRKRPAKRKR